MLRKTDLRRNGAALLACVALPLSAWAQTVDVDVKTTEPSDKPYAFTTGYDHIFETDVHSRGQVSIDSFQAGLGGRIALGDSVGFSPRVAYELNHYDFTGNSSPFSWENIHQYTLLGLFDGKVAEHWSLLGGPIFRLAGEGSSSWDKNAASVGALLGFNYLASKDFSIGLSLGFLSQLEDDPAIVPIPNIRWKFADQWTFKTGIYELGGRTGLGPELIWSINDTVDLGIGAQYQRRRYRLDDHGTNRKGIGEETVAPLFAKIGFHPVPEASIDLFAGAAVAGELQIQDKNGDHTFNRGYKTAPILGLRGEYRF